MSQELDANDIGPSYGRDKAMKDAIKRKNPLIITDNLDAQFKQAIANKSNPQFYANALAAGGTGVRKHTASGSSAGVARGMARSASAFSVDKVFDAPHSPFRNRFAVETPSNLVEMYQRFRYYFKFEPLVGIAIELHAEFPLSTFELKHEDPTLQDEFNEIAEDLNLFQLQLDMAVEYNLIGEAVAMGMWDDPKDPQCWKAFVLLNPLNVDIASVPLTDGRSNTSFRLKIDNVIKQIVGDGPTNKNTGDLYRRIPEDVIKACKGDGYLKLSDQQVSHFKRPGNYFKVRGESLLNRVIHLLNYRDKIRDANSFTIDRHCVPAGTEVLTSNGFKVIEDITTDDTVCTYNLDNNQLEYQNPTDTVVFPYDGNLIHFKNRKIDCTVTPNHRMLVNSLSNPKWRVKEAKDVTANDYFKGAAEWVGIEPDPLVRINKVEYSPNMAAHSKDVDIPIEQYLEYAGYFIAEGSAGMQNTGDGYNYEVRVCQTENSRYFDEITSCAESMPFNTSVYSSDNTQSTYYKEENGINPIHSFKITNKSFYYHMKENFGGICFEKKIPTWIKNLPKKYLKIILYAMCKGDGSINTSNRPKTKSLYFTYTTTSPQLADDVMEVAWKLGHIPKYRKYFIHKDCITGKTVATKTQVENSHPAFQICWSTDDRINRPVKLMTNSLKYKCINEVYYKGNVHCLTVPNHFFVIRQNGRLTITGNSTPRELWKVGEPTNPATEEELSALAGMIENSYLDPTQSIVTHHAVVVDTVGGAEKVLPLRQELDAIEEEMLIGLMLNKGFLDSSYGAYANMSVALDVLISRYIIFRQRMERWQRDSVWGPLCKLHKIYKPTPAELSHRIRIKNKDSKPWVPKVIWSKYELRDSTQKVNLFLQLREKLGKPGFPRNLIYQAVGENPKVIKRMLQQESKEEALNKPDIALGGGGKGGGGGGGLGDLSIDPKSIGLGGDNGGAPAGGTGTPTNLSNTPDSALPEFNGGGQTSNIADPTKPASSNSIQNQNSGTGGAGGV